MNRSAGRWLVGAVVLGAWGLSCSVSKTGPAPRVPSTSLESSPRADDSSVSRPAVESTERSVPERVEYQGTGLGTKIRLVAYTQEGIERADVEAAFVRALGTMERLEAVLSGWRDDSDVGRVNASPGHFVSVSKETLLVIEKALWSAKLSDGAFDITFQSMGNLWKFGDAREQEPSLPSPSEVARARSRVDYRKVIVDAEGKRVKIGPHQQLGLGGIAKGYIVDRMVRDLSEEGLDAFLVQAGGDLYAAGTKPGQGAWEAGVQDPRQAVGVSFAKLDLEDRAFSTAGDYARAYFVEGERYHHIIDPQTGYPARACRSVTVWAETAIEADALDDAVFILGPEAGLELIESLEGVGAVIVDAQNRLWVSKRLRDRLRISHLPSDGP